MEVLVDFLMGGVHLPKKHSNNLINKRRINLIQWYLLNSTVVNRLDFYSSNFTYRSENFLSLDQKNALTILFNLNVYLDNRLIYNFNNLICDFFFNFKNLI